MSAMGAYFQGEDTLNCPNGGLIADAQECQLAASKLGIPYNKEISSDRYPSGCLWDYNGHVTNAYFNTLTHGQGCESVAIPFSGGICKQSDCGQCVDGVVSYLSPYGADECPAGQTIDRAHCYAEAVRHHQRLEGTPINLPLYDMTAPEVAHGCLLRGDGQSSWSLIVMWNLATIF